jgi:translation initiation factor 1A
MVKNEGGNKTKGQARKFVNTSSRQGKPLRVSLDSNELYGQVTKNLGNGMCHVICIDGVTRLCHIRGKFRGRGKKDNFVGSGSWLLVGLRDFESVNEKKMSNCDLLEVYNDFDKDRLKTTVNIDWSAFIENDNKQSNIKTDNNEGFIFSDQNTSEYNKLMEESISSTVKDKTLELVGINATDDNDEINIDDI